MRMANVAGSQCSLPPGYSPAFPQSSQNSFFAPEVELHTSFPLSTKSNSTEQVSNQGTFNSWEVALFQETGRLTKPVTPTSERRLGCGRKAHSAHWAPCCSP